MVKTIIADLEELNIEREKSAQMILKINWELSKMGFKKAYVKDGWIDVDTIENNLTIYFRPSFSGVDYADRSYRRSSFEPLTDKLSGLSGSDNFYSYYGLKRHAFENQIELKLERDNKKYVIGDYLPDRNIVIISFSLTSRNWNLGKKNEYVPEILGYIKEVTQKYEVKERNIEEIKEKLFVSKFTKSINNKIRDLNNSIERSEDKIEDSKRVIAEEYNDLVMGRKVVGNLKVMLGQIKDSLLEKVNEIKQLKFVKDITLTQEGIILKFNKIFIKVNGEDIEMGEYTISLKPNAINIINDSPVIYKETTYHSPHISGDKICFGEQKTLAYELLGRMELKKLTHFLYLYLNSYNSQDTYLSMGYWIEGKENGGEVPDDYSEEDEEYYEQDD